MDNIAYIGVGSNIGNRLDYISEAVKRLDHHKEIKVVNTSSIYETDPVGYTNQASFLNMVIKIRTTLAPLALLESLLFIEEELGRKREIKWGPRTLDLDILLYNQENIKSEKLMIPHPRMLERAFVIVPLLEVDLQLNLPGIVDRDSLRDKEGVRIWKRKNGEDVFALFES
ncbi:2-amino-4-hydroxy-6-hydroxymethyldihydropteridinediphosphokinase [Mesobacillus persicus]|uniref:2-amino-4-hydroxy-6-hydroxymethyldihydropteridine diphosphokinase n=1 Tax=Mesobacillus persicus TaxID=930146 RepID=A0A1H8JSM6_9BACI|nr:2-amino-4-hydroxy-6-hydroxymethyldihydropteridine diphosphokinase [Mesobacillus persicus]SEN83712.1 2-amino-4-hydroxy-6-hydroxymethyldihydropteridinediphosphokinase [Mesobacillus persicus]